MASYPHLKRLPALFIALVTLLHASANAAISTPHHLAVVALQSQNDYDAIAAATSPATVVGLGEGSHGTKQFFEAKFELFKALALRRGFRTLAIEGDWSDFERINTAINSESADLAASLAHQGFQIWKVREMLTGLEWIRHFNLAHPSDPIRVVGIDFQRPAQTMAYIQETLRNIRPSSDCFTETFSPGPFSPSDCASYAGKLLNDVEGVPDDVAQKEALLHAANLLSRYARTNSGNPLATRDANLADSVLWIASRRSHHGGVAIWAHDGHVATSGGMQMRWKTMGAILRESIGSDYYAIGSTFGYGSLRAKTVPGLNVRSTVVSIPQNIRTTIQEALDGAKRAVYVQIRNRAIDSTTTPWLHQPQTMWAFGGVVSARELQQSGLWTFIPADTFDGLIYIPVSAPSEPLL